ncbi:MAG: hypothetical protein E4H14_15450 [Candidatus Thorarchaeota archaeon]|nr:MAG: hypothetical protein E4H14_15450 [Candidatus Thorarchaeota archaeon]
MGELDVGGVSELYIPEEKRNSKLIAAIMLLLGLFAPLMMSFYGYGWMTLQFSIQSMFWMYFPDSYYGYTFYGFSIMPVEALFSMFPLILLRMVPVSQIYRYYTGKTTRKRAFIASFVGDGLFIIIAIPNLLVSIFFGTIMLPLPFQLIFSFLLLWKYRIPEPTTPWEGTLEPKSWWEKKSETLQEKPADDEDKLW